MITRTLKGAIWTLKVTAKTIKSILLVLLIITQTGCSRTANGGEPVTGENYFLDTICTISVYEIIGENGEPVPASKAEDAANSAIDKAFDRCAELDKTLSRTQAVSEISKVNDASGEWTEVSDTTREVVEAGIYYSALCGGKFDITVGGVTDLWDFHASSEDAKVPDPRALSEAVKHVDYNNIEINGNMLRITDPDSRIDLGGIAKGYIGDRLTEVLEEEGVTSGIINLGGNVICIGAKDNSADDDDGAFVIGVEAPYSDRSEIVGKIKAKDMTLVTSGVYERQITVDGKVYHHILSTETGYSVETDLDSVTLTAPKGQSADIDALSTICLIYGCEKAKEMIENIDGIEAVFILHDGTIEQTSGMQMEPVK